MTRQAPEGNESATQGHDVEVLACENWPLQRVPSDHGDEWWCDAKAVEQFDTDDGFGVVEVGTPFEIKSASWRIDANGGPRRGRWLIRERSHQKLLDADGEYVLAVRSPDGSEVLDPIMRPAWWVDELVTTWSPCRPRTRAARRVAQIPWSRAFEETDDGFLQPLFGLSTEVATT